jgi:hypothetical protein
MTSEDIKYVMNSIISALDFSKLDMEDKEDILSKIEDEESDYGMEGDDLDMDLSGDEELDLGLDMDLEASTDGEMGEEMYGSFGHLRRKDSKGDTYYDELERNPKDSDIYGIGDDEMFDTEEFETFKQLYDKYGDKQKWFSKNDGERMFDLYKEKTGKPFKVKTRKMEGEMGEGDVIGVYSNIKKQRNEEMTEDEKVQTSISKIMDGIFGESNVDKVLEKYFLVSESEKKDNTKKKNKSISVVSLAESIEQKTAVEFMLSESKELKFLGKTNKGNLIFEHQGNQINVTSEGEVL